MDAKRLQDRVNWGLNRVAAVVGLHSDVFRPSGPTAPLDKANRYLRLPAAFTPPDGRFTKAPSYGEAVWQGHFDAAYTRDGDYLVQDKNIWFIAAQRSLLPVLCVKTNRILSIIRPAAPATGGSYGSAPSKSGDEVISEWPASVLGISGGEKSAARLPDDTTVPNWIVLLPSSHQKILLVSDIVRDESGTAGIVIAAEQSDLGWRLNIRQVTA